MVASNGPDTAGAMHAGAMAMHADPMLTSPKDLVRDDGWLAHVDDGSELLAMIFQEWSNDVNGVHQAPGQQQQSQGTTGSGSEHQRQGSGSGSGTVHEPSSGDADAPGVQTAEIAPDEARSADRSNSGKRERKKRESASAAAATKSRWRQSQCRMGGLEAEAKQQQALVEEAAQLNTELKFRALALEHTLAARDKQVQILKQHRAGHRPAAVASSTPTSSGSSHSCNFSLGAADPSCAETTSAPDFDPATATVQSLAAQVRHFVSKASILLLQISGSEASGADNAEKLGALSNMVHTFCGHMGSVFVLNTQTQFEILARRLDVPEAEALSSPPPGHWELVVREMHATASQLKEVAACWEFNGAAMMKLQEDIQAVSRDLSEAVESGRAGSSHCLQLQERLSTALLNQALTCRAMGYILFGRILTPLQTARAIVHSFPYFPNGRELLMRLMDHPGGNKVTVSTGLK